MDRLNNAEPQGNFDEQAPKIISRMSVVSKNTLEDKPSPTDMLSQVTNPQLLQSPYGSTILSGKASEALADIALRNYKDASALPFIYLAPLVVAILSLLFGVLLSVYYVLLLIFKSVKQTTIDAPLNNQTVDFDTISALSFGGTFNYIYFMILPLISIVALVIFGALAYYYPPATPISAGVKGAVFVLGIASVFVFVLQTFFNMYIGKFINTIKERLDTLNEYMCSKIYKNTSLLNFIKEPKGSIISVDNTMQQALRDPLAFPRDITVENMAKLFYTITMFNHYHKIGLRNDQIFKAFNIFQPLVILSGSCRPADFLTRYGTFIEDISDTVIYVYINPDILASRKADVEEAISMCNDWITNTSTQANTIYPEDAYSLFLILVVVTLIVQISSLIIFKFAFGDPTQSKVSAAIQKIMNVIGFELPK